MFVANAIFDVKVMLAMSFLRFSPSHTHSLSLSLPLFFSFHRASSH